MDNGNDIDPWDQYDDDLNWPVEGCWEAYELGIKHGKEDGPWMERPMLWFNDEEYDSYHEGYIMGRRID